MLVGEVGAGKTMVAASMLEGLAGSYAGLTINLSARTSSNALQDTIEGRLEKRTKARLSADLMSAIRLDSPRHLSPEARFTCCDGVC